MLRGTSRLGLKANVQYFNVVGTFLLGVSCKVAWAVRRSWKTAVLAFHNKKGPIKSLDGSEFCHGEEEKSNVLDFGRPLHEMTAQRAG